MFLLSPKDVDPRMTALVGPIIQSPESHVRPKYRPTISNISCSSSGASGR